MLSYYFVGFIDCVWRLVLDFINEVVSEIVVKKFKNVLKFGVKMKENVID